MKIKNFTFFPEIKQTKVKAVIYIDETQGSKLFCYLVSLKVHKIEIFFGFDFEICIISLLVMSKY